MTGLFELVGSFDMVGQFELVGTFEPVGSFDIVGLFELVESFGPRSGQWSERRDRVSFGNISALRAFAFCVLWRWESQEYRIKKDSKPL